MFTDKSLHPNIRIKLNKMRFNQGLSLIQQVAPNFVGVNKQPAKVIGRHMDLGEACVKWILFIMNIIVSVSI
jgi:hypothetical protein